MDSFKSRQVGVIYFMPTEVEELPPPELIKNCKNEKKLSDCLVFCCNILADRQLTVIQLSANCLDGLLMSDVRNSYDRNCMRW